MEKSITKGYQYKYSAQYNYSCRVRGLRELFIFFLILKSNNINIKRLYKIPFDPRTIEHSRRL